MRHVWTEGIKLPRAVSFCLSQVECLELLNCKPKGTMLYTSSITLLATALILCQGVLSSPLQKRDRATPTNVFLDRVSFINADYVSRLQTTLQSFQQQGDNTNARRVKTLQGVASTFTWYTAISSVGIRSSKSRRVGLFG
jgi:hypothetical protein